MHMINLGGVFNFFIILVEIFIIGGMIWLAIDFIGTDDRFKRIAKFAVGGVLLILFLFAVRDVFGGGGGSGMNLTPVGFLYFAIGVILTLIVWFVIDYVIGVLANWWTPLSAVLPLVRFVLAGLMLVVILLIAANVLFGTSVMGGATLRGDHHSQLDERHALWLPTPPR
jgi:hypothetical protein